jgi:hypothetical protein
MPSPIPSPSTQPSLTAEVRHLLRVLATHDISRLVQSESSPSAGRQTVRMPEIVDIPVCLCKS